MGIVKSVEGTPIGKVNVEVYNAPAEVAMDCRTRRITDSRFDDMTTKTMDKDWHGVSSYEEALEFLKTGYQANVEKLDNFESDLVGIEKRIKFMNDVVGYAPVVPLAIMGVPNCMMNSKQKPIKAKVLDVFYEMGVNAGVSSDALSEAGRKILSAIMQLEMQGYKFNLYTTQCYWRRDSGADMLAVKIKGSNEPLNVKRMSFAIAHTAFFRVIGFDWYSKFPRGTYRIGYGQDATKSCGRAAMEETFKKTFGDNVVFFSATELIDQDVDAVKEMLTKKECK